MGGISAIFGLGRRQQEKVKAAALERCETPQCFIVTAVQDRLEQDGLMVKIRSEYHAREGVEPLLDFLEVSVSHAEEHSWGCRVEKVRTGIHRKLTPLPPGHALAPQRCQARFVMRFHCFGVLGRAALAPHILHAKHQ